MNTPTVPELKKYWKRGEAQKEKTKQLRLEERLAHQWSIMVISVFGGLAVIVTVIIYIGR